MSLTKVSIGAVFIFATIFLGTLQSISYSIPTNENETKETTTTTALITTTQEITSPFTTTVSETTTAITTIVTTPVVTTSFITTTEEITSAIVTSPAVQGVVNGEMINEVAYYECELPENENYTGFKAYEPYTEITAVESKQWILQQYAITDTNGFRMVDNRYLVAVGTFCNAPCCTYIDIILENGTLIPCIVGDIKSDAHTDETHTYSRCMCASEFIVDEDFLLEQVRDTGNVSYTYPEWNSKVQKIRVYYLIYF